MKIKKAIRRLEEAGDLLGGVVDRYDGGEAENRALLENAKNNVLRVKAALEETLDRAVPAPPVPPPARGLNRKTKKSAGGPGKSAR